MGKIYERERKRAAIGIDKHIDVKLADLAVNDHRSKAMEVAWLVEQEWDRRHPEPAAKSRRTTNAKSAR